MNKQEKLEEIVEKLKPIVNQETNNSNIRIFQSEINKDDVMTITLYGGLNGRGEWKNYLKDLANIFEEIEKQGYNVWVIKITNDCPDDVFNCLIGIGEQN